MTRDELLDAISDNIRESGIDPQRAALEALTTIEGLGFVIVPRVPDDDMVYQARTAWVEAMKRNDGLFGSESVRVKWDGAIAGSPLYRGELDQPAKETQPI
jgi:hypothetical protein